MVVFDLLDQHRFLVVLVQVLLAYTWCLLIIRWRPTRCDTPTIIRLRPTRCGTPVPQTLST